MAGPLEQFEIKPIIRFGEIACTEFALTNSAAFMLLNVGVIVGFFIIALRPAALIPGRLQSLAEVAFEFIAKTVREICGEEGMKFFPLVFSLFMFILTANVIGLFPYSFTVTSHIIVTAALAMIVFATVTIYGVIRHGFGFLRLFWPSGIPVIMAPLIIPIEVISYISRPISHAARLFAVMLAGHIALKVFAGFVVALGSLGALGLLAAVLPLFMTVAVTALEALMAVIQAYVFTMLTCMYLKDALHPAH